MQGESNLIFQKNRTRRNQWKNHPTHEYFYPYHHPLPLYRLYQRLTSRLSASRNSLGWKFLHEWAKNRAPSRPTEEGKREQSVGKRGGCKKHRERERRRGTGRNGKDTHPETPSSPIYFYRQFSLPFLLDLSPPNHPWRGISRFFNPRGSPRRVYRGGRQLSSPEIVASFIATRNCEYN